MTTSPLSKLTLLSALLGATLLWLPADAQPVDGEREWRAADEASAPAPPRPPDAPRGYRHGGPPPGRPPMMEGNGPGAVFQGLVRARMEAARLREETREIELRREAMDAGKEELAADRQERQARMLELRAELVELEKAEFMDRVSERLDSALIEVKARREAASESAGEGFPRMAQMEKVEEKLKGLQKATTDFDAFSREIDDLLSGLREEMAEPRLMMLEREVEMLNHRVEMLRTEIGRVEDQPVEPVWRPGPRPPMPPEDGPLFKGTDLPPGAEMHQRFGPRRRGAE